MDDVRIGEILKPVDADETGRREKRVRLEFWRTAKRAARYVPFMDELVAAYYCALDPKTPFRVRARCLRPLPISSCRWISFPISCSASASPTTWRC